jgi:hypothetical protein
VWFSRSNAIQKDIILKKLSISLIALAAISTAPFASERGYDLRDSDTYFGKYSAQLNNTEVKTNALAIAKDASVLTNFERVKKISAENESGHDNGANRSQPSEKPPEK